MDGRTIDKKKECQESKILFEMCKAEEYDMIGLKVIMGDPARSGDAFAWVGAAFDLHNYEIQFKLAKQFFHTPYNRVAEWAHKKHEEIKPNFMGIETNNRGQEVLGLFYNKYKMQYLQGINTSSGLTEKTRAQGFTMDKTFMVHWFKDAKDRGMIKFPSNPSRDMQELINQIPKISMMLTPGGKTTYKAYRGQHDDLFMAALLCCNFIRLFINQQEQLK